ncbi:MAG: hypothetical protein U0325_12650 [Polyangiales bacterium]
MAPSCPMLCTDRATLNHGFDGPTQDRVRVEVWEDRVLAAVADGVGGMHGGEAAAELVVTSLAQRGSAGSDAAWVQMLRVIDRALVAGDVGQSTAVVLTVTPLQIVGACVGDSHAWWFPTGAPAVHLSARAPRKPLLGSGEAAPLGFVHDAGTGRLVLASDGLFRYASAAQIEAVARAGTAGEAAEALVALVRLPSGGLQDDLGLAVVDIA